MNKINNEIVVPHNSQLTAGHMCVSVLCSVSARRAFNRKINNHQFYHIEQRMLPFLSLSPSTFASFCSSIVRSRFVFILSQQNRQTNTIVPRPNVCACYLLQYFVLLPNHSQFLRCRDKMGKKANRVIDKWYVSLYEIDVWVSVVVVVVVNCDDKRYRLSTNVNASCMFISFHKLSGAHLCCCCCSI